MKIIPVAILLILASLAGCQTTAGTAAMPPVGNIKSTEIKLSCPTARTAAPNADYVGPYVGVENIIPLVEMSQDIYCSDAFKAANFPLGFVSIYGSSRVKEKNPACDSRGENCSDAVKAANDETLKRQEATLQQLDDLQKAAEQLKIFAKRG